MVFMVLIGAVWIIFVSLRGENQVTMNKFTKAIAVIMLMITAFCILACTPEVDPAISDDNIPEGAIKGVFSISNSTKVFFSQGNLQYQASTDTWRFAENQWDIIGEDNNNVSETSEGWIDLFEWETSGIDHGALEEGNWRAMTIEEWRYLLEERPMISEKRYVRATVNDVRGIVVFPDNWLESIYELVSCGSWGCNVISKTDWIGFFEENGAVFIPTTPVREGDTIIVHENGLGAGTYWSSTGYDEEKSFALYFGVAFLVCDRAFPRYNGYAVRLVCSVE